jgi:hypothetical protein
VVVLMLVCTGAGDGGEEEERIRKDKGRQGFSRMECLNPLQVRRYAMVSITRSGFEISAPGK